MSSIFFAILFEKQERHHRRRVKGGPLNKLGMLGVLLMSNVSYFCLNITHCICIHNHAESSHVELGSKRRDFCRSTRQYWAHIKKWLGKVRRKDKKGSVDAYEKVDGYGGGVSVGGRRSTKGEERQTSFFLIEWKLEACSAGFDTRASRGRPDRSWPARLARGSSPTSRLDVDLLASSLRPDEASILRSAVSGPDLRTTPCTAPFEAFPSRLSDEDLTRLLRSGGVAERSATNPHITLPVFTRPKSGGTSRLLVDGGKFDELSRALPAPLLPGLGGV